MPAINFDQETAQKVHDTPDNYSEIPAGEYQVRIVNTEEKVSQAGHTYINLTLEIIGPHQVGRKVFDVLNMYHPKADTLEIAYRKYTQYCLA